MNKEQHETISNAFNCAYFILNKCSKVDPISDDDKKNLRDKAEQIVQGLGRILNKEV